MKITKLLKIALVLTAMFTFSACEDEEITVKNTTGDPIQETVGAD